MPHHTKLHIYKASAGSGKTFTLAVEYIKLLIKNPLSYRNILAVTFTNKATAEMKMRILGQLNGIAHGYESSQRYFQKLCEDASIKSLNLSEVAIRKRAGQALTNLLHDYHRFRVTTIDSFFQSIVRELAYELDLTANLRVDLKAKEALEEAVKSLVEELGDAREDGDSKNLMRMIFDFVKERIEEERSWNVVDSIKSFGMHIFDEKYLKLSPEERLAMGDATRLKEIKSHLTQRIKDDVDNVKLHIAQLKQQLALVGHDETTLKGKTQRGAGALIVRLQNIATDVNAAKILGKSWRSLCKNEADWTADATLQAWVKTYGLPLLRKAVDAVFDIGTCRAVLENINEMMLIDIINTRLRELNNAANRFLLADTGHFLQSMIEDSDVPFIYERAGVRYQHIMIDEFQDTSEIQWGNFRPLLNNSLSQNQECLIVGDVKQSIYRWRNSDWSIFNGIEHGEFADYIKLNPLKTNYRSAERVVTFNNAVCKGAVEVVQNYYENTFGKKSTDIGLAYADVEQDINPKKANQGFVRVDRIVTQPDETGSECTLRHVERTLRELIDNGVPVNKITILVRTANHGEQIVHHLETTMPEIKVVSNDAYKLSASSAVHLLVQALRVLENPSDKLTLYQLVVDYQRDVLGDSGTSDWAEKVFASGSENWELLLPAKFQANEREQLIRLPLYELCETLYDIFGLHLVKGQGAYLFSFYNNLLSYLHDRVTTLSAFLKYWDDEMQSELVQMGNLDGLKIMTIHKSKGLEFHTVIMPFFEWRADGLSGRNKNYVWCAPRFAPFNEIPLLPIQFRSNLGLTAFDSDYETEVLKQLVDNLNLMYVAFTRAEQNLIVLSRSNPSKDGGQKGKTKKESSSITMQTILDGALTIGKPMLGDMKVTTITNGKETYERFERGSMAYVELAETEETNENILTQAPEVMEVEFFAQPLTATFMQSNESRKFLEPRDEENSATAENYMLMGNVVHAILEHIETHNDLPNAMKWAEGEGLFESKEQRENIARLLQNALSDANTAAWFSPHWRVMNECSIYYKEKDKLLICRPDRVIADASHTIVIDYKTSHKKISDALAEHYNTQVKNYMKQLEGMGYPNVEGYVWYIMQNKVVPVSIR